MSEHPEQNERRLRWRAGWQPRGVTPDLAEAELERVRAANGGSLTPELVTDAARPEDAPLHPAYEWDDAVAGELYRHGISRTMIRAIKVVVGEQEQRPRYVAVKRLEVEPVTGRPRVLYRAAEDVAANEAEAASAVALLTEKLHSAQVALDEFKHLLGTSDTRVALVAAIAEALATARELSRTLAH